MLITEEELLVRCGPQGAAWLRSALADARRGRHSPPKKGAAPWELRFAAAGRSYGHLESVESVRVLLLCTARPGPATVRRLYDRGTGAERRAVLLALPHLELSPDQTAALLEDALRTNDTRLISAALETGAAAHLGAHAWRHAVLKCLFTEVPLAAVAGLADRARGDGELARMLGDFAAERTAAGRPVPEDLSHVLALTAKET
jgi:hypothetical protein